MKKTIKFINEFYYYDTKLKLTVTFKKDTIIDEDNKYFKDIYNKSKDYYIEIKVEQPKPEVKKEILIELKEEVKEEFQAEQVEEIKTSKKNKTKFLKNKKEIAE